TDLPSWSRVTCSIDPRITFAVHTRVLNQLSMERAASAARAVAYANSAGGRWGWTGVCEQGHGGRRVRVPPAAFLEGDPRRRGPEAALPRPAERASGVLR